MSEETKIEVKENEVPSTPQPEVKEDVKQELATSTPNEQEEKDYENETVPKKTFLAEKKKLKTKINEVNDILAQKETRIAELEASIQELNGTITTHKQTTVNKQLEEAGVVDVNALRKLTEIGDEFNVDSLKETYPYMFKQEPYNGGQAETINSHVVKHEDPMEALKALHLETMKPAERKQAMADYKKKFNIR